MSLRAADLPKKLARSAVTNAAGVCTVTIKVSGQEAWEVSQITVEMATAPVGAACALRINGVLVSPLIATGDAAAGDPPLPVHPGDVVEVIWTGATPQTQGRVLVLYRTAVY